MRRTDQTNRKGGVRERGGEQYVGEGVEGLVRLWRLTGVLVTT